jgi:hypothetical protein
MAAADHPSGVGRSSQRTSASSSEGTRSERPQLCASGTQGGSGRSGADVAVTRTCTRPFVHPRRAPAISAGAQGVVSRGPSPRNALRRAIDPAAGRAARRPGGRSDRRRSATCCAGAAKAGIRVNVDLDNLGATGVTRGEILEHRRDHSARPAPRRPEVHRHGNRGGRLLVEAGGVSVDEPRERRLAPRASGSAAGDRTDPIARATRGALDDRHQRFAGAWHASAGRWSERGATLRLYGQSLLVSHRLDWRTRRGGHSGRAHGPRRGHPSGSGRQASSCARWRPRPASAASVA